MSSPIATLKNTHYSAKCSWENKDLNLGPNTIKLLEEGLGEETGVLEGLDLPSVGGELKQGSDLHMGAIVW